MAKKRDRPWTDIKSKMIKKHGKKHSGDTKGQKSRSAEAAIGASLGKSRSRKKR